MDVRTCKGCGRLFNYLGANTPVCPNCMKAQEEKYEKCRQYIKDNPGANIQTVSEVNEVSLKLLKQWVREERLSFTEGSLVGIECEGCGKNILTGRFCNDCKGKLAQGLNNTIKKPAAPEPERKSQHSSAKMRFLE